MKNKHNGGIIFLFFILFSLVACKTTEVETQIQEPIDNISEPVDETENNNQIEETNILSQENDLAEAVIETEEIDSDDEEYLRSINKLEVTETVTKKEFADDKAAILKNIDALSDVMETRDAAAWRKFIDPESINYYSNPVNLRNAQKKLPNKSIVLKSIDDYFFYVFIPSRKRSRVDEIRYISKTNIKAVQVKEDYSTVVYYYFKKIDDKWYVHLPPV